MLDKAAACLDITASKNHQIIASQNISIPMSNLIDDNTASAIATAIDNFCQQHQLKNPACTLMLPASSYQMLLVEAPPVNQDELAEALQWQSTDDQNNDGQIDSDASLTDNPATVSFYIIYIFEQMDILFNDDIIYKNHFF